MKVIIRRVKERNGLIVMMIPPPFLPAASGVCVMISGRLIENVGAGARAGMSKSNDGEGVEEAATVIVAVAVELDMRDVL
jgi:hypothetical protein